MKIFSRDSIYYPHYKKNINLALPIMLSQLGNAIVMLSDTIMVGRLGTNELAAVTFGNAVFIVGFVLLQGITFGSTPIIGNNYANGNHRKAGELFANSLIVDILACALIGYAMWQLSHYMDSMGQDAIVCQLAIPYYQVLVLSLIPYVLFFAFKQYLEGLGNTRYSMIITFIGCGINVVFNYLLIFGKFGFPKMGVTGAAVATLIARTAMPICYILLFRFKQQLWRRLYFFKRRAINRKDIQKLWALGLPIGFQMFIECLTFSVSAIMAGWFGATAMASHEIAMNISSLTFMLLTGIASGTTISVSHQLGTNNLQGVQRAGNAALRMTILYSSFCAVSMIIFCKLIPHIFSTDPEVISISAGLLIYAGIYQISDGLQTVSIGALRGISDVKVPMLVCSFCYLFVNLPFSYFVAVKMGVGIAGIWWGFILGLSLISVIMIARWRRKTRQTN